MEKAGGPRKGARCPARRPQGRELCPHSFQRAPAKSRFIFPFSDARLKKPLLLHQKMDCRFSSIYQIWRRPVLPELYLCPRFHTPCTLQVATAAAGRGTADEARSVCRVRPTAAGPSLARGLSGVLEQVMRVMSPSSPGPWVPRGPGPAAPHQLTQYTDQLPSSRAGVCPFK